MANVGVLAQDYRYFKRYISENKLNPSHFEYISSSTGLRGRRGIVLLVGKWWRNSNYRNEDFTNYLIQARDIGRCSLLEAKWEAEDRYELLRAKQNY